MHREVITDLAINGADKDVQNCTKNGLDLRNTIVNNFKHEEQSNSQKNHREIFPEDWKFMIVKSAIPQSEESPSSDQQEDCHRLEEEMQCDEQKTSEISGTIPFSKPSPNIERSYENENSSNNTDDEEAVLLNGIATIFVIQEASCDNEQEKISDEKMSTKEPCEKQEEKPKRKLKKKRVLAIADALFSVAVVAPLVVCHWRGLWTLMDVHHELFSALGCFFFGAGLHTIFAILKNRFHDNFAKELEAKCISARLWYRLVRMSYTYVFSTACIMHWRGGWLIFDDCNAEHEWFLRFATVISVVILFLLRSVRNLLAPPYVVGIDKRGYVFRFPTRFDVPAGGFLSLINAHEINVSSQGEKIIETEA